MSETLEGNLIDDDSRRVYSVLGREFTGRILYLLTRQPFQSASEVARTMSVHIATAQKYLEELRDLRLVSSRNRQEPARRVEEYYLSFKRLDLSLDTERLDPISLEEADALTDLMVKERAELSVAYEVDHKKERVNRVLFLDRSMRRRVNGTLELSDIEGKLLWHMPFPSEEPRYVMAVLERAGLKHVEEEEMMRAVHHLRRVGLIEVSEAGAK